MYLFICRTSRRQLRNDDDKDLFTVNNPELLQSKGVNSLAGFNRFSKLLDSLRSNDQNSSENQFSRSWYLFCELLLMAPT